MSDYYKSIIFSQRNRDSNFNFNRDMVILVILVVMIQALLNWVLSSKTAEAPIYNNPASLV